jgi:hypothetical protein
MSATLDRISALLAKAERTDNEAEADAYLMKAQQLATLASVDLAVARARIARREARQQPESRTTTIGEKGRRANQHLISLFVAVAHANDAQVDVASNSTYVIGYGMPADLDVVETIFASLAVHMVHAGQAYVTERTWVGETYVAVARTRLRRRGPRSTRRTWSASANGSPRPGTTRSPGWPWTGPSGPATRCPEACSCCGRRQRRSARSMPWSPARAGRGPDTRAPCAPPRGRPRRLAAPRPRERAFPRRPSCPARGRESGADSGGG